MADTNVAIKLYKTSATSKRVGINVTNSIDTTGYALYVNGSTNITGSLTLGTALPIASGGTGKTTAAAAWTALGGGASGKHPDNYFALASHTHSYAGSSSAGGAATLATRLDHITLNSTTIDNTAGSFAFSGSGDPWSGTDWVGLQIGDNVDKFQISANGNTIVFRENDNGGTNTSWSDWVTMLTSANYTSYAAPASHTHSYAGSSSAGGAATNVNVTTKSTGSQHYLHCSTGNSGSQATCASADAYLYLESGAVSLNLGGSSTEGRVTFRSNTSYYVNLIGATATANRTITLPNATGTVSLEGHTHNVLQLYEARATTTSLNKAANYGGAGAMFHLVATSATTTGKPPTDSTILQMNWDNNGGYDSQFGISTANNRAFYRSRPSEGTTWSEIAHITAGTAVGGVKGPTYVSSTGVVTACNTLTSLATGKGYGFEDFTLTDAVTSYNYLLMIGKVTSSAPIVSTIIPMAKITTTEQLFQIADYGNNYRSVGIKKSGNNIVISSANGHAQSGSTIDIYGGL